jgi:hypothetical protein
VSFQGTFTSNAFGYNGFGSNAFPGDLRNKFFATNNVGTPGTYTRTANGGTWTKTS